MSNPQKMIDLYLANFNPPKQFEYLLKEPPRQLRECQKEFGEDFKDELEPHLRFYAMVYFLSIDEVMKSRWVLVQPDVAPSRLLSYVPFEKKLRIIGESYSRKLLMSSMGNDSKGGGFYALVEESWRSINFQAFDPATKEDGSFVWVECGDSFTFEKEEIQAGEELDSDDELAF